MINILDYFDEEKIKTKKCIVNFPKKRYVFVEESQGEIFFIKKFVPHGKLRLRILRALKLNLHLERDKAKHYEYVSKKLKKINIPHVPPFEIKIVKKIFLKRESVVISKNGGQPLSEKLKYMDISAQKSALEEYYYYYKKMFENKICISDYNLGGALIDDNGKIKLIDFDTYKVKIFLNKKTKKKLIKKFYEKNTLNCSDGFSAEICEFTRQKNKELAEIMEK